jgi:hypothetical protein
LMRRLDQIAMQGSYGKYDSLESAVKNYIRCKWPFRT